MKQSSDSVKTILVTLGRSTEKIVLLLSTVLLSRYLSQYDYGTYRQVFLVSGMLIVILNFGIPNSINYFLPQYDKKGQKSFVIQTIILQFVLGFIGACFIYISASTIASRFDNPELIKALKIFIWYPVLFVPSMAYANIFISINKAKLVAVFSPLFGSIKVLLLALSVILKFNLIAILQIVLFSTILQMIIVFVTLLIIYKGISFTINLNAMIEQIKFAFPMGISAMLGLLIVKIDQIMISSMFSVKEYAVYSVGAIEIPFINMITVAAMAVITPYLVIAYKNGEMENFLSKWRNSLLKLSYIIFPTAIFFVFFGSELITIIYGEKYSDSSVIFQIYQLKLLVKITFFSHILLTIGRSKQIMLYTFITLLVNIILNFVFIYLLGYKGAAIATVISAFIISILQLIGISKTLKIRFIDIWPWSKILLILTISIVAAFAAISFRFVFSSNLLILIFGFLCFSILYFVISQTLLKKLLPSNLHYKSIIASITGYEKN